ncbi:Glycosyltransferase involved in cell wall bisynthesis [Singulisphaera sp. GP187]|uniref:glycosyltransferase n=1 Tax=Singulisphaera sp. GP187 TaxID=1882752 RepID=UPI000925A6A9|nr:glycosyltransferase [Singulisphaera sp. GP187]SIN67648.1 Glycosyltransferase involved in cell wall bisynthesis [Singulisphaera sp. GP187]
MPESRQPRILHVVTRLGFGGLEVEILNLVHALERLGFEQGLCCLQDLGELADQLPKTVPVWLSAGGSGPGSVPRRTARIIREWRPDIIHVRNGWGWPDAALAWLLALRRGRLVFSFHGWDSMNRLPWRRAFIYRQLARLTPALVSISAETADRFAYEAGIAPSRFTVLDSGIDVDRFLPAERRERSGRLVIGCVSRLDPIKAHDVLIDAFARAVDGGARDLELRLVGDGPTRGSLERLVAERGLGDRVRFLGMCRDIPDQLRAMDLFVLPSHREGRPISIMEAMASGLPVIATRVGSVPGLVENGRTGLLVEPGDVAALARAITDLADDPEVRSRLAEASRRFAVAGLSVGRMAEQYAAFYKKTARAF